MTRTTDRECVNAFACYIGFFLTGLIYLFFEKESSFIRFHAMQSTMVFSGLFVLLFVCQFYPFGWLPGLLLSFSVGAFWITLMWKALQGEEFKVFLVGKLAGLQLGKISK